MPPPKEFSGNVRVVARIRPLAKYEVGKGSKEVVVSMSALEERTFSDDKPQEEPEMVQVEVTGGKKRWFELDAVFDKGSTQKEVYGRSGTKQAVCEDIFKGFNCTILAYGQTGAGKSYSMGTASHGSEITEGDGMIPRACYDLFEQIKEKCDGNAKVELSYLEIYNEELRDLLVDDKHKKPLKIRETLDGEVYVAGLEAREVHSPRQIGELMDEASGRRIVAATAMNATSSRSHAMCILRVKGVVESDDGSDKFSSKLTLVDLAGSERIKKTGAQGSRVKEGININKSLLVLGQVVAALGEKDKKRKRKPPYRDSKLTRLLQDSLGGNSRTIMVACTSPADFNVDESINTMRYATSARNIKNSATRNLVKNISPEEAAKLQRENQLLKQQVADLKAALIKMAEENEDVAPPSNSNLTETKDNSNEAATKLSAARNQVDEVSAQTVQSPDQTDENTQNDNLKQVNEAGKTDDLEDNDQPEQVHQHGRLEQLQKEVVTLRWRLATAKASFRKSSAATALELPALKLEVSELREKLEKTEELEEENNKLREEVDDLKNEAECAEKAAAKLTSVMEKLKDESADTSELKRIQFDHLKKEENWMGIVCRILESNKNQVLKLTNSFDVIVQVAENPDMTVLTKRTWWGGRQQNPDEEKDAEERTHEQLWKDQVLSFKDQMKKMVRNIDDESMSMKEIRNSLHKEREVVQGELTTNDYMGKAAQMSLTRYIKRFSTADDAGMQSLGGSLNGSMNGGFRGRHSRSVLGGKNSSLGFSSRDSSLLGAKKISNLASTNEHYDDSNAPSERMSSHVENIEEEEIDEVEKDGKDAADEENADQVSSTTPLPATGN